MSDYVRELCKAAKDASVAMARLSTVEKTDLLLDIAAGIDGEKNFILSENKKDIEAAEHLSPAMKDRLLLTESRINAMAISVREIAGLPDPIGRIENIRVRPSGIRVGQMRVPLGVVTVIYEARPNVTTDIAALSVKSGNACILRGGKEALYSNIALHSIVETSLAKHGLPKACVSFMDKSQHEFVTELLKQKEFIDLVIPRGGEGLIKTVSENSLIPVLKHDKGLCHIFVDKSADENMAANIIINAKTQRPEVCNAAETLLIHNDFPHKESLLNALLAAGIEIRGCEETMKLALSDKIIPALPEDWDTEYLAPVLSVKITPSQDAAEEHIAAHGSAHSEAIITNDYLAAEKFLREVDSAAVLVNASTRFHDGGELGLGAEVGISTEKLHARGAMGVEGLTTLKYVVYGHGEVRA